MNENKIRHISYIKFWESIAGNKSLHWIEVVKTEITDKICESIGVFLQAKSFQLT